MTNVFVSLATFVLVIFLTLKQPVLKIPFTAKKLKVDYGVAPLMGVAFLLITSSIGAESVLSGIVGDSFIQPYAMLILFFSLAYICLSVDATGFLAYLALRATRGASGSGRRLFLYFFALSSFLDCSLRMILSF